MEVRREHLQIARRTFVLLFWEEVSLLFGSFFFAFWGGRVVVWVQELSFFGGKQPKATKREDRQNNQQFGAHLLVPFASLAAMALCKRALREL